MGTERSDKVHDSWRQSSEKFDYYVTSITGALCAYISQTFVPQKIAFCPNTLELIALLVLAGSVFAGFKRIEKVINTHRLNHSSLYLSESLGELITNYTGGNMINEASGTTMSAEEAAAHIEAIESIQPEVEENLKISTEEAAKWYVWRNWLLATGFFALVAAKVWSAYVVA